MLEPIIFLSIDYVLESHLFQVETYGGDSGLRDAGLVEPAIAQPQASFDGGHGLNKQLNLNYSPASNRTSKSQYPQA